ncbi:unnamed protein product [Diatraea saccharalis]|uniref:Fatty acyl-CoA reductase n=1 Tax=Diatraea saccharalis TaxID=40085 RepID=A0A9N9RD02_9NEOP|nr:unnamed protein product [Diatraea saccharalis]
MFIQRVDSVPKVKLDDRTSMTFDVQTTKEIPTTKEGGDITYMDMIEEKDSLGESQIQKMFAGSSVFLTGATGFLGKLIVEKLLRSCPEIKKLYLLVRPKKNKDTTKRIQEQFEDVLYSKLKKERPNFFQKIAVVEGDVGQLGLGISEQDKIKLMNEVEFIFHGAATVRFDEPLKTAVEINVRGTRELFQLAKQCGKLKALVHISTAYSNCTSRVIEEKFYESIMRGEKLIDLVETIDENTINNITPGLLGNFPNTYAYTKSVAENVVAEHSKGLPVAVFRPSIIIATAKEPVAGWIDNVYGPTGVVVGAAVGLIHTIHCEPKAVADLVPADMVVNACIASAWKTAKEYPANHEDAPPQDLPPPVYNYVSSEQKPLTWEKFMDINVTYGLEVPSVQAMYYYLFALVRSRFMYMTYCLFLHWIPAYIVDGIAILIGKKPMLRKAYTKISKFSDVLSYFSTQQWKFYNKNVQELYEELCDADKQIFDFNMSSLDWNDYFYSYVRGIRIYLLKDPLETVPSGRAKFLRLKCIHYFVLNLKTSTSVNNEDINIMNSGVQKIEPCSVGLILYATVNNTSPNMDYEVVLSPDQCCLSIDSKDVCNVMSIEGSTKTLKLVAPLIEPFERRGYCIVYLDSKPTTRQRKSMRDEVKISFDTRLKNSQQPRALMENESICTEIDQDPLNDCKPVDCEIYYNGKKPFFDSKTKRCIATPLCISDTDDEVPRTVYDQNKNKCIVGESVSKDDINFIKKLTKNTSHRKTKDILIIRNHVKKPPELYNNHTEKNISALLNSNADSSYNLISDMPKFMVINKNGIKCLLTKYLFGNRWTFIILAGVIVVQCFLICTMIYCLTKTCGKFNKKKVVNKFFNYRHDASVTTPLIYTSNIDTDTTDFQYLSETSNIDKMIKCYKSCQKERKTQAKISMSDDILSKCLTRRDWKCKSDKPITIDENNRAVDDIIKDVFKRESKDHTTSILYQSNDNERIKKLSNAKVNFENEDVKTKKEKKRDNTTKIIVNKAANNRNNREYDGIQYDLSERELKCHSYNYVNNDSNLTGFKPSAYNKKLSFFETNKNRFGPVSMSTEKGAQAVFSNDSLDDFLSERGMVFRASEDLSKYSFSSNSNGIKGSSVSSEISSKTSKNNVLKNVISLFHKKSSHGASSEPGGKKKSSNSNIELIHMSKASVYSSYNGSDYLKNLKQTKDSRTSL